jgi:phthiocerol/phenolphthiocerol synthesis type-I polyketide synthase C
LPAATSSPEVDPTRWSNSAYLHPSKSHPGTAYTFAAGSIGDVKGFDAGFFAISPREAALMDPQQRLLLEMSWETFENAGIRPSTLRGSATGVYIGIATVDYSWRLADDMAAVDSSFATGNTSSIAANRLSYFYDLRGPSMAIDTACSSSLVAFHQACRAIATGEVTQALTGAISLHLHPMGFVSFSKATMLSRRGRCRVFDASADGYVRSEGGGVFLLKDYDQAVADGNPIIAVVAHSSVNTDGRKSGLTVPSPAAQASLLINAYKEAGIEPRRSITSRHMAPAPRSAIPSKPARSAKRWDSIAQKPAAAHRLGQGQRRPSGGRLGCRRPRQGALLPAPSNGAGAHRHGHPESAHPLR